MKYVHGTDEKRHDMLMVWGNRALFALFLLLFLFFLGFFVLLLTDVISGGAFEQLLVFLLALIFCAAAYFIGLLGALWGNSRYSLDEQGITVVSVFRVRRVSWDDFEVVFVAPVFRGARSQTKHDYLILMISKCGALTRKLTLSSCQWNDHAFLAVRLTEERRREFEKYCTISDPPDIPVYKYF
ncbi:MAG: PH domain-containing protein [Oscillospiraceae bacterium]|nr:PH domain-containing protein [Oscillospiraceae bacterium]